MSRNHRHRERNQNDSAQIGFTNFVRRLFLLETMKSSSRIPYGLTLNRAMGIYKTHVAESSAEGILAWGASTRQIMVPNARSVGLTTMGSGTSNNLSYRPDSDSISDTLLGS